MIKIENKNNELEVLIEVIGENSLIIRYVGKIKNNNFNLEKANNILSNTFSDGYKCDVSKLEQQIRWLRTIFDDLEEKVLIVTIEEKKENYNCHVSASFKNKKIVNYSKADKIAGFLTIITRDEYKTTITTENPTYSPIDKKELTEFIDTELNKITRINNIKGIKLRQESQILCEIYKLFYNEIPDFSIETNKEKAKNMLAFLDNYGISLGDDYYFSKLDNEHVNCFNLENLFVELAPFGKIDENLIEIKLSDEVAKAIKTISTAVHQVMDNNLESLKDIVNMKYEIVHYLPSNCTVAELVAHFDKPYKEVFPKIKQLKKIESDIEKAYNEDE